MAAPRCSGRGRARRGGWVEAQGAVPRARREHVQREAEAALGIGVDLRRKQKNSYAFWNLLNMPVKSGFPLTVGRLQPTTTSSTAKSEGFSFESAIRQLEDSKLDGSSRRWRNAK